MAELIAKENLSLKRGCVWTPRGEEVDILLAELSQEGLVRNKLLAFQIVSYRTKVIGKNSSALASKHCQTLSSLIDSTGAIFENSRERNVQKSSFKETAGLMDNLSACLKMFPKSNEDKTAWQRLFKGIVINSERLDDYSMGFFETKHNLA